jgi:hypothetical protein
MEHFFYTLHEMTTSRRIEHKMQNDLVHKFMPKHYAKRHVNSRSFPLRGTQNCALWGVKSGPIGDLS